MDTPTPITKTQFNTAIHSMQDLLQTTKNSKIEDVQISLLRTLAKSATTLAKMIESK